MTLALAYEQCVRTRSVAARCQACVDVCPHGAVTLAGPRNSVQVKLDTCTSCGLCQGECPTGAFSGVLDVTAWMETLPPGPLILGCGQHVECLGSVSAEELATVALRHGALRVDVGGCARCRSTGRTPGAYAARVAGAQAFLHGIGSTAAVTLVVKAAAPVKPVAQDRRGFLSRLVPGGLSRQTTGEIVFQPQALRPALLRLQAPTQRREQLRATLHAFPPTGRADPVDDAEAVFTSSKVLNTTTCTVCNLCVNTCPTGALTFGAAKDTLRFDEAACVRCGTCHDVCEPLALTRERRVDVAHVAAGGPRPLGRLNVKNCGECGVLFRHDGGDVLCPRCAALEDEARELTGGGGERT